MSKNNTVLVVVAHADDEALGCGGTLARYAADGREVHVLILADGESSRAEMSLPAVDALVAGRNEAAKKAGQILGCKSVQCIGLADNRLDGYDLLQIVQYIEKSISEFSPSTLLTHHSGDVNIDHRIIHEAVLAATRPQIGNPVKELLFFEVPSSTEWTPPGSLPAFTPNCFIDISKTFEIKKKALEVYANEMRSFPHPRSLKAVEALSQWRGATVGVTAAEAFIIGRSVI
jgi:LmbE family N-acetylglucosaminyl deacetylase